MVSPTEVHTSRIVRVVRFDAFIRGVKAQRLAVLDSSIDADDEQTLIIRFSVGRFACCFRSVKPPLIM
jgi:hypothetical protein